MRFGCIFFIILASYVSAAHAAEGEYSKARQKAYGDYYQGVKSQGVQSTLKQAPDSAELRQKSQAAQESAHNEVVNRELKAGDENASETAPPKSAATGATQAEKIESRPRTESRIGLAPREAPTRTYNHTRVVKTTDAGEAVPEGAKTLEFGEPGPAATD